MQFNLLSSLALAGSAVAAFSNVTDVTVTEVVTALTTYCPEPTELTVGGKTYTVTKATTLTITDCPCTITKTSASVHPTSSHSSAADIQSTYSAGAGKVGVAGFAAAAGAAVYLL